MFKAKVKSENSKNSKQQFLLFTFQFLLFYPLLGRDIVLPVPEFEDEFDDGL